MTKEDILQMIELSKFTWEDGGKYAAPITLSLINYEQTSSITINAYSKNYYLADNGIYLFKSGNAISAKNTFSFISYGIIRTASINDTMSLPNASGDHKGEYYTKQVKQLEDKWKEFISEHNKK